MSTLLTYVVVVAVAFGLSSWYAQQADAYDLNRDGVITLDEQSPSQSEAYALMVNDAGRNLSVFFAAPWAVVSSSFFFGIVAVARRYRHRRSGQIHMKAEHSRL